LTCIGLYDIGPCGRWRRCIIADATVKNSRIQRLKPHQFKPGQSGNPKGRPRNTPQICDMLRKMGNELAPGSTKTIFELIMRNTLLKAVNGEPWAVQFVADRTEGKALDRVQVDMAVGEDLDTAAMRRMISEMEKEGFSLGEIDAHARVAVADDEGRN